MENQQRIDRAERALNHYFQIDPCSETAVIDLLTDLRHYCEDRGLEFEHLDSLADMHFEHESTEEAA